MNNHVIIRLCSLEALKIAKITESSEKPAKEIASSKIRKERKICNREFLVKKIESRNNSKRNKINPGIHFGDENGRNENENFIIGIKRTE